MSLIIVETITEQPLTTEVLNDAHERVMPCLEARNVVWRYSLLSADRQRMICTFDAPDAGSVRDAYRKGDAFFSRIWAGELIQPEQMPSQPDLTLLKVVEGTSPSLNPDDWNEAKSKTLRCYTDRGIEWVCSYLSLDRTRLICEVYAPDAESIREAQRRLEIPFDRVWSAERLKP
jgi:Protein of unknown function (DUF4242)